jgi:phosphate-selective porin OprO/OprP
MYTLGLNKFVVGHKLKVQSDISYSTKNGESDAIIFRTGFELHF